MASTELKRKARRNRMKAIAKQKEIQRLQATPVIKNIDVAAIKKEFAEKKA